MSENKLFVFLFGVCGRFWFLRCTEIFHGFRLLRRRRPHHSRCRRLRCESVHAWNTQKREYGVASGRLFSAPVFLGLRAAVVPLFVWPTRLQ